MKYPIVSTFCIACLVFTACAYLGYYAAVNISYRHKQSRSFTSLGPEEGRRFRSLTQTFDAYNLSRILPRSTPASFQQDISYLQALRAKAPQDVWPILDIGIAADHTVLARLYQQANNSVEEASHRAAAQAIFHSLGWKESSDVILNRVADKRLHLGLAK